MTTLQPNDLILNGKYRIDALIGEGAFAQVYRATHLQLQAPRALKILRHDAPGVGSTEFADYAQRFQLEAQLGAKLNNQPHVIQVHDFERDGEMLILVMEYASGGSLADRIDQARQTGQPIPIDEVIRIALEVADGLAAIHALDVVHRDLKPSNILFDVQGRAKVADLGLAQVPGGPSMRSRLSQSVPHPGTPAYMSPEQENTTAHLTSASDVYALGLIAFEMLTGRECKQVRPGTHVKSLRADTPDWLDELLTKMLSKNIEERPWNGAEVVEAVRSVQSQEANRRTAELEQARRAVEEKAQREAQTKVTQEAEERARREVEAQAKYEAEEKARRAAQVKAQQEAEKTARRSTTDAQTNFENGIRYHKQGNYDQAISDYSKAISLDPSRAEFYFERGKSYSFKNDFNKAISDCSKAIDLNPRAANYYYTRAVFYRTLESLTGKTNYEQVIADYTEAIELAPTEAKYYHLRGVCHHNSGNYVQAIADSTRAIKLDPTNADYWFYRGRYYFGQKQYDQALSDFGKAIEIDPNKPDAYFWRSVYYGNIRWGSVDEAIADCSQAIRLNPTEPLYYSTRAKWYSSQGKLEQELSDLTKAIELSPQNADYYYQLGLMYCRLADCSKAVTNFNRAVELDSTQAVYFFERGLAYYQLCDFDPAIADFRKASEVNSQEIKYQNARDQAMRVQKWSAFGRYIPSASKNNQKILTLAPGVEMVFVQVEAGEFLMGSADDDPHAEVYEKPLRRVYLGEYWIGKYPVTVAQFAVFAKATNFNNKITASILDRTRKANHPITELSWFDALAFCEWVSQAMGVMIRLPSQAEWEKAARGTDGRVYPWGNEAPDHRRCNFWYQKGSSGGTTPVGKYSPLGDSPYGCADMSGNVREWTSDWPPSIQLGDDHEHVSQGLRGSSYSGLEEKVRVAACVYYLPVNSARDIGFRCVMS